jgi:hypothetical protein
MSRNVLAGFLVASLVTATVVPAPLALAAASKTGGGGGGSAKKVIRVVGRVTAVNASNGAVTLTTGTYYNPTAVFYVNASTALTLNGKACKVGDLRVGDAADAAFDDRAVVATSFKATR